jgi:hypothetical protein
MKNENESQIRKNEQNQDKNRSTGVDRNFGLNKDNKNKQKPTDDRNKKSR